MMNAIKDVHAAVINNDYEQFSKKTAEPVPVEILGSKDANGLNSLHKLNIPTVYTVQSFPLLRKNDVRSMAPVFGLFWI